MTELNQTQLVILFNIQKNLGNINLLKENSKIFTSIIAGKHLEPHEKQSAYKLGINLTAASGKTSVDIEFCSYNPKDGRCNSRPGSILTVALAAVLASVAIIIICSFGLCIYCCKKKQSEPLVPEIVEME